MNNLAQSRFASVATMIVGAWVALSPIWISATGAVLASLITTGVVMVLAGLTQLFWKSSVPSSVSIIAAVWLFMSAFLFSNLSTATKWNATVSAIAVALLAIWDGLEISDFNQSHSPKGHYPVQ